jgi:tRNA(His) 5'-end guanylyltransferase
MKNDDLGTRMKEYEGRETERKFLPYLPIYSRIDGRSFSKFTRNAERPFDASITNAIHAATKALIEQTHAIVGYVQSDEISLVWETTKPDEQLFFDGKVQKMTSVLSGIATSAFMRALVNDYSWNERNPDWINKLPHFDARVFQMPNRSEAANMFLWREMDARKNAITMVASTIFSHKELQGVSGRDKLRMIAEKSDETGISFDHFPSSLTRGTFMKRVLHDHIMTEDIRMKIPENKRPPRGTIITRSEVTVIDVPPFNTVANRVGFLFDNEAPVSHD